MTMGEAKALVYMLLDEYSTGGEVTRDPDMELKMAGFFDIAQKQLARRRRLLRSRKLRPQPDREEYAMPEDFWQLYRIWLDGKPATGRYRWRGNRLLVPARDAGRELLVEYFAMPATIPADAGDEYAFELPEDACACMPYYVAAQQLLPDLVLDYSAMLRMYEAAAAGLDTPVPGETTRVWQKFYG